MFIAIDNFRYETLCVPFYSLMLAMKMERVDYFSLDVEGPELEILRTIPFHLIDIRLIGVEWSIYEGIGGRCMTLKQLFY